MTNVDVTYEDLVDLVGKPLSVDEFVDRITMMGSGPEGVEGNVLTFDIFPNRPDFYSVEGIARGLRGYLGLEPGLPAYEVRSSGIDLLVEPSVADVRPVGIGGIVRNVELEDRLLRSLVDLQEKLHLTVGRRRRKVAIGIHDLDRVTPPFTYKAVHPTSVRFVPLGRTEALDLQEILERHDKGREYGGIVAGKPLFPIIMDVNGTVLSFPPVINGIVTQLTPETRNLFVDVTGTDFGAVSGALNILVTSLAERGARIESVRTRTSERTFEAPDLSPLAHKIDLARANGLLGLELNPSQAVELLRRMRYDAHAEGTTIHVLAPAYRTDLLHEADVAEDLAIAWGYDRYPRDLPKKQTHGKPRDLNEFSEALRVLMIGYGYQEIMSLTIAAPQDAFASPPRVSLQNPVSEDLTTLRSALVPSLLRILALNKHREMPQRVFEIADVVIGPRNVRHFAAATIHHKASFTEAKSLVLSIARDVHLQGNVDAVDDPNFIAGRAAILRIENREIARFGEIHPGILEAHGLVQPVVAVEADLVSLHEVAPRSAG